MTNSANVHTLGEAELNLVSGGLRDNPDQDRLNKMFADENGSGHTFGAAIGGNLMSGGSHGGQIPVDF